MTAPVAERWRGDHAGQHYAGARWKGSRARNRDPQLVRSLCARHALEPATVLDCACGTGRLSELWGRARYTGIDASRSMLAEHPYNDHVAQASVHALPFDDDSFELVVACRLLHHFADPDERRAAVRELARVSRNGFIASIFDRTSWHGWRRRRGLRTGDGRVPIARSDLEADLRTAGFDVVAWKASLRFVSMQTFVLARKAR